MHGRDVFHIASSESLIGSVGFRLGLEGTWHGVVRDLVVFLPLLLIWLFKLGTDHKVLAFTILVFHQLSAKGVFIL